MTAGMLRLLLVDDDPALLAVLELGLRVDPQFDVTAVSSAPVAVGLLAEQNFDLVITDYSLGDPQIDGMEIMRCALLLEQQPLVILITAFASLELTLNAIRLGAYDFLTKPFQLEELQLIVRNAAAKILLEHETRALRARNEAIQQAFDALEARQSDLTERIEQMLEEIQRSGLHETGLGSAQFGDSLRRRYQEHLSAYIKQSRALTDSAHIARKNMSAGNFSPLELPAPSVEA